MDEDGRPQTLTPLHQAANAFAELLEASPGAFTWVGSEFASPCGDAISHRFEEPVVSWMEEMLARHFDQVWMAAAVRIIEHRQVLRPLFTVAEEVLTTKNIAVMHTRPLLDPIDRDGSDRLRVFAALATWSVDGPETHGQDPLAGNHLHPMDEDGKHLQYKLLFDPRRGQSWLSWERHGKGDLAWGHPERDTLGLSRADRLLRRSLYAVKGSRIAPKHTPFREWASTFERIGSTARVAVPAVVRPTSWPKTRFEAAQVPVL